MRQLTALCIRSLNQEWVFRGLGALNRRRPFLSSVFLMYPASHAYLRAYVSEHSAAQYCWQPQWLGVAKQQHGGWTLVFAISNLEHEFQQAEHQAQLVALHQRMQQLRQMLGVEQNSFAGVLPSVLAARGIRHDAPEAQVTVHAVQDAVRQVLQLEQLPADTPLIVLGGGGFIGRQVCEAYRAQGRAVAVVDPHATDGVDWPQHWFGQPAVVLNLSRKHALDEYVPYFWPKLVLVNEVYPAPSAKLVTALQQRGVHSYHVVGLVGRAWPSFPASYAGAIPCCAGLPDVPLQTVVRRLHDAKPALRRMRQVRRRLALAK